MLEYNPNTGFDVLKVQPVSMAQARQRLGRAGRQSPGRCYRLYTEEQFYSLQSTTTPEIQRCNLSSVVLQLMALGIQDVTAFEFLDAPLAQAIQNAVEQLSLLGAIDQEKSEVRERCNLSSINRTMSLSSFKMKLFIFQLTNLGRKMARFPLEPRFSKTLLKSPGFDCGEDMLTIIALLSVDTIFYTPPNRRDTCNAVLQKYRSAEGDHITLLNIYRAYKSVRGTFSCSLCKYGF